MLYHLRKLNLLTNKDVLDWNRFKFLGESISNKTIGFIGFGRIAQLVFSKLQSFNCQNFFAYDPYIDTSKFIDKSVKFLSMDDVIKNSDIISLHLPLTNETSYLIDCNKIALFKKNAILVNSSRGGIVKESDLYERLKQENIFYIADVIENEPNIDPGLLSYDNVIITLHIASLTKEANKLMINNALDNYINDIKTDINIYIN